MTEEQAWDFPPCQAARLVSSAAQNAARAWAQPVPETAILDVTWDLHRTFRDLGIALRRLSRFQHDAEPDVQPINREHGPGSHIYRAGGATVEAGTALRDREVLEHVRRNVALGLPAGGDPEQGSPAIAAALELADAAAMAYRIVGRSPSGSAADIDAAVGAFMHVADNLDAAAENLASRVPGSHSRRLTAARAGLEQAYAHLREALICSAVDFQQPRSGKHVLAMRERYPILPHRSRSAEDAPVNHAAGLAGASFPPDTVLEAGIAHADAPRPVAPDPRLPRQVGTYWRLT